MWRFTEQIASMVGDGCTCVWNLVCNDRVPLPATTDLLAVKTN